MTESRPTCLEGLLKNIEFFNSPFPLPYIRFSLYKRTFFIFCKQNTSNPQTQRLYDIGTNRGKQARERRNLTAKSKIVKANEKTAEKAVDVYRKIEQTIVSGYRKIEDAFVDRYLTHDGESVEEAKARLRTEQENRQIPGARRNTAQKRTATNRKQ